MMKFQQRKRRKNARVIGDMHAAVIMGCYHVQVQSIIYNSQMPTDRKLIEIARIQKNTKEAIKKARAWAWSSSGGRKAS